MRFTYILQAALVTLPLAFAHPTYENALQYIESQHDLAIITSLIKADPVLTDLYSNVKDATVLAPLDSGFPSQDLSSSFFRSKFVIQTILTELIFDGLYPSSVWRSKPKYVDTKLAKPSVYVNTSRGKAVGKLFSRDGDKSVELGIGLIQNLVKPDIKFKGGLIHKISGPLGVPINISHAANLTTDTPQILRNDAILNISALGLLDEIEATPDVTLFTVDNPVWDRLISEKVSLPSLKSLLDYLEYDVVVGEVVFEGDFDGKEVKTLNGETVKLSGADTRKYAVNDAKVVRGDLFVSNGVFHILDRPLSLSQGGPVFG